MRIEAGPDERRLDQFEKLHRGEIGVGDVETSLLGMGVKIGRQRPPHGQRPRFEKGAADFRHPLCHAEDHPLGPQHPVLRQQAHHAPAERRKSMRHVGILLQRLGELAALALARLADQGAEELLLVLEIDVEGAFRDAAAAAMSFMLAASKPMSWKTLRAPARIWLRFTGS